LRQFGGIVGGDAAAFGHLRDVFHLLGNIVGGNALFLDGGGDFPPRGWLADCCPGYG
jgi:hypothetical protein